MWTSEELNRFQPTCQRLTGWSASFGFLQCRCRLGKIAAMPFLFDDTLAKNGRSLPMTIE
jgi:hypothetical protein